ncbi:MAG: protein kinase [Acidobacteria bacterium]|nr:protein kinase [Acidobacteriota bacterium]
MLNQLSEKPLFFRCVLAIGVIVAVYYVFGLVMIGRYGTLTKDFGWKANSQAAGVVVTEVDPQGPAAEKLQVKDRILAINGESRIQGGARDRAYWLNLRNIAPEVPYCLTVARQSAVLDVQLEARLIQDFRNFIGIPCYLLVSLAFYSVGMLIGLSKPEDRVARLASMASLTMAAIPYFRVLEPLSVFFQPLELGMYYLTASVYPVNFVIAFHFYYSFPQGAPKSRFWESVKYVLYALSIVLTIAYRGLDVVTLLPTPDALAIFTSYTVLFQLQTTLTLILYLLVLSGIFVVVVRNYRLVPQGDQRRRIKLVVYSTAAGVAPFLLNIVLEVFTGLVSTGLLLISELAPIIIPVGLGYTIIKHRVFNIQVVIRRGVQYLLAKNALRALISLPLIAFVVTVFVNPNRTVKEILVQNQLLVAVSFLAGIGLIFRQQVTRWVDRKFFREEYNQEQIMLRLIQEMKTLNSFSEISKLVNKEVDAALHPKSMYVFEKEQHLQAQTLVYSTHRLPQQLSIPDNFQLLRTVELDLQVLEAPFILKKPLPRHELEWLEELGVNLIIPMCGTDHGLIGLLLLGEKKSEEPYTPTDQKLLLVIAEQMAVVYENTRLKERVGREQTMRKQVLERLEEQNINIVKECPDCGTCYDSTDEYCTKDNAELVLSLPVERVIERKYRLEQLLGKGGMGAVYEATDLRLNRRVAIKIILSSMFGNPAALRRFEREARAVAMLNHPNVIAVHDYGRTSTDGAFLVMELITGISLREATRRQGGTLGSDLAADWFEQILNGIQAAHESGIVHRDLKPENILLVDQPNGQKVLKILDFGLAKIKPTDGTEVSNITEAGTVMGTMGYMSPEQFSGEEVDERTDLFTVGVMVIEALTGQLPFRKRTMNEYLASLMFDHFHLRGESPEIQALDRVLQQILAKERTGRYPTAEALKRALIPAIRRCPPLVVSQANEVEIHQTLEGISGGTGIRTLPDFGRGDDNQTISKFGISGDHQTLGDLSIGNNQITGFNPGDEKTRDS